MSSHVLDQSSNESSAKEHPGPVLRTNGLSRVEISGDVASRAGSSDRKCEVEGESEDDGASSDAASREGPAGDGAEAVDEQTVISRRSSRSDKPSSVSEPPAIVTSSRADLGNVLEGTSLGHFRLEKFVGGGGMGSVFRAIDMRLGRTVAVKVLSRDRTEPETLRRFQNEAQSAARLDHENIARVYYVGEDRGLHFIVFEFIEGVNIRDLVEQKGPLPLDETISYMLQVAEALEHASQRHVVHRDIKPSNILVTADGRAKLVDMGLARLRIESDRNDLTASGVTLGTFDYISPEQARDPRIADVRSDLYSLGCTLYFMLTGRPPFPEGTLLQKLLSHSSDQPGDPRLIRPDLDEQVVKILDKLLAKQPRDRHQQPNELIGDLLLVADRLQLPGLNLSGAVWAAPGKSRWSRIERILPWLLPVVVLFLSVFALERLWSGGGEERGIEQPPKVKAAGNPASRKAIDSSPREPAEESETALGEPVEAADQPAVKAAGSASESAKPAAAPAPPSSNLDGEPVAADSAPSAVAPRAEPLPGPPPSAAPAPAAASPSATEVSPTAPGQTDVPGIPSTGSGDVARLESAAEATVAAGKQVMSPLAPALQAASPTDAAPPAAVPVLTRLVVAAPGSPVPADAKIMVSLAAACREAAALGIGTIELHFNGIREESAFSISSPKLSIRNGPGFHPTIVFRPGYEELAGERRMIRVGGGSLEWAGVHIRWELPPEPTDGWALFSLQACDMVDLQDAVLTICNVNTQGSLLQDRVSVLEWLETPRPGPSDPSRSAGALNRLIPPYLGLTNCVVRGQAALIRCEKAIPLRISGRQCLFILSDSLLEAGGRETKPVELDARIELVLKQVTAILGGGLCRLSSDTLTPFQLDLVTDCKHSILYLTDANAALIERRGVRDLAELEKHLYVRGRDNFYPGSDILLCVKGDPQTAVTYGFTSRNEGWYQEESPRFSLMWESLPSANLPLDRHLPSDYLLDQSESNPALYDGGDTHAGVDASQLPTISDAEPAQG